MKLLSILTLLSLFSINAYAEKCEGINACVDLYTKLTGEHLNIDSVISDEMSLAAPDTDLTKENAKVEFSIFSNKNALHVYKVNGSKMLVAKRSGEFLTAPIHIISENNIPMMLNKDGLVTFVYHAKGSTAKLAKKTTKMLSKKMPKAKSINRIIEFQDNNIILVSDTYEKADKVAREWMKLDK